MNKNKYLKKIKKPIEKLKMTIARPKLIKKLFIQIL